MKAMKVAIGLIVLFVTLPIWFYLMYKVLQAVNATDLMWFLFWVYVPFSLFAALMGKLVELAAAD